jgi:hypothetical protein
MINKKKPAGRGGSQQEAGQDTKENKVGFSQLSHYSRHKASSLLVD